MAARAFRKSSAFASVSLRAFWASAWARWNLVASHSSFKLFLSVSSSDWVVRMERLAESSAVFSFVALPPIWISMPRVYRELIAISYSLLTAAPAAHP